MVQTELTQRDGDPSPTGYTYDDYWLGATCEKVFELGNARRQAVVDMGRRMAELTIPEVMPPEGYRTGDNIPGNNQSIGAYCVNNLASKLVFQAHPPGLPMMNIEALEYKVRQEAEQDPELWANMLLGFAGLERAHRQKLLTTVYIPTAVQYYKLLLIAGNGAWKHTILGFPTFYTPIDYVVRRDRNGMVRYGVTRDKVALQDLDPETRKWVMEQDPEAKQRLSEDEPQDITIYTGVKLVGDDAKSWRWQIWQEYNGELIPDTAYEDDFETPSIRFDGLIPVPGQDWYKGYCEEYRGDLFAAEAFASGLTDGAAMAAFMLLLVNPGSVTSLRQVRTAKNLSAIPGRAEDLTMFRTDKSVDLAFVANTMEQVAQRLSRAFLLQSSIQRNGERVTKEEIVRLGSELDQAMGGIYGSISQTVDRPSKLRFMYLHEEANRDLPPLPKGVVEVQVTSGINAMGQANEATNLLEVGMGFNQVLGPQGAAELLGEGDWAMRFVAAKGITHPSSMVPSADRLKQSRAEAQQQAQQADLMSKAAGPLAGAAGQAMLNIQGQPQADQGQQ